MVSDVMWASRLTSGFGVSEGFGVRLTSGFRVLWGLGFYKVLRYIWL